MKYKLLDPKVDFIFKQIFGQDNIVSKKLLLSLLNAIFERKGSEKIKSIEYLNPYLDKEYSDDKQSILDIMVKTERDELIDIEMQVASSPYYLKRSLWYWASVYERQLDEGQDYANLRKCVVVNLLNFDISKFKEIEDYHTVFEIKERFKNIKLMEDLEMHYIELKKIKEPQNVIYNIHELDDLSKWTLFFNDVNEENKVDIVNKLKGEMEEIEMASEILERVSQDEKARAKYESRLRWILDRNTMVNELERVKLQVEEEKKKAEKEKKKAEEEKKKAEEEKRKAEEEKRKAEEAQEKLLDVAKNLLDVLDVEIIAEKTGLTVEVINSLRNK